MIHNPFPYNPNLMISVSGVRGIIPTGLDLDKIVQFTLAFASIMQGNTIVLGRDSRPSGEFMENIIKGILLSLGKNIISLGITSTPTVKAIVNSTQSSGGIMISASHNPMEWNAFKFIGKNGFFLQEEDINQILSIIEKKQYPSILSNPKSGTLSDADYEDMHIESVLKMVNVSLIQKRKFKVMIDAVNGGGSYIVPKLLKKLGCTVTEIHCSPDGTFPRPPEPSTEALINTSKFFQSSNLDVGFALDPDADRLVVLSPEQGAISEEYTVPLSLMSILEISNLTEKNIVVNMSSSFITEKLASKYNCNVIRSKVGEANVVSKMLETNSFFGGEGNGGVIDSRVTSFGRDSLVGIANILHLMAYRNNTIDSILNDLPTIYMSKSVIPLKQDLNLLKENLKAKYPEAKIDEQDGIRLDFGTSWVHLRASNTEPILRLIAEAETTEELEYLLKQFTIDKTD